MYIRIKTTPNSPRKSVQIVESSRVDGKVKQKIVHHVGIAWDEEEEKKLRALGEDLIKKIEHQRAVEASQMGLFPMDESEEIKLKPRLGRRPKKRLEEVLSPEQVNLSDLSEEKRVIEGIHDVCGHVFDEIYSGLCGRKRLSSAQYTRLRDVVLGRLANPCSKHRTQHELLKNFAKSHDLDALYRMMDKVHGQIDMIKSLTFSKTQSLLAQGIEVLLFDVTTLYFESISTDDLRAYGYSKDHRFNTTQVVLALATNPDGLPVGYELFAGNKAEVSTLVCAIEKWQTLFPIESVCFVGDRAMMSKENVALLDKHGYQYVIAAKLKSLPESLKCQIVAESYYQPELIENALTWVREFEYKDQRLIVSYRESRAKKDAQDRQRILDKLEKQLGKAGNTKKLVTNRGAKQYVKMEHAQAVIDTEKIEQAQLWDGLHGVITNIRDKKAAELLGRYRRLWRIEESFRINKHTLKMRPIFHFKPERIQTHIAICYMAFSVLRHVEYRVNLTKKVTVNRILETLMDVQASILIHRNTKDRYRMPSRFSHDARRIYQAFNLERANHPEPYIP